MRATAILSFVTAVVLASCTGGNWSSGERQRFTASCLESEAARGTSNLTARAYCECALGKTSKRYATAEEASQNRDSAGMAQDLEICRRSTR